MNGSSTYVKAVCPVGDAIQAGNPTDVYQVRVLCQPLLKHDHECGPSGDEPDILSVSVQEFEGLL
jgi:hypothetical protein